MFQHGHTPESCGHLLLPGAHQMFILKPNEVAHTYPSYWGMEPRIT